jgi:hypothetical protein
MRLSTLTSSVVVISPVDILFEDVAMNPDDPLGLLADLVQDPRDLLNGFFAHVNLRMTVSRADVAVDTPALEATKRVVLYEPLVVRIAILEARRGAAGAQIPVVPGFNLPNLCSNVSEEQVQKIFDFLGRRTPNRAPRYTKLEVAGRLLPIETATRSVAKGEVIEIEEGEQLVLRGRAGEEDKEVYQLIDDNCELQSLRETLAWSWFTSRGTLSPSFTTEGADDGDDPDAARTVYTPPQGEDLDEVGRRARIWSVLRDGRGGSDSRVIDVVVRRP